MRSASVRYRRVGTLLIAVALAIGAGARLRRIQRVLPSTSASRSPAGYHVGEVAPEFALPTLNGRSARLTDYRGKVVLLNFWATWCAPCRVEMPWLAEFDGQYDKQGLQIVGINLDDPLTSREKIAGFARDRGVTYPILLGNNDVADAYGGARFLPQTFFIGPDGRVLHAMYGITTKEAFEAEIKKALARGGR
jgi:thiol-disulfide isomerase/thioredoxin